MLVSSRRSSLDPRCWSSSGASMWAPALETLASARKRSYAAPTPVGERSTNGGSRIARSARASLLDACAALAGRGFDDTRARGVAVVLTPMFFRVR
jgi:hypothetical protein